MMLSKTAILLFTQTAKAAAQQKLLGLSIGDKHKEQVFEKLLQKTRKEAQQTGLDIIEISCKQQKGNSFGQRIATATQQVFDAGYEHIIILGTDTPNINSSLIIRAANQLHQNQAVLGHAVDGGAYLIAFNQVNFDAETFANLSWQDENTAQVLTQYFIDAGSTVSSLAKLADIDSYRDLLVFITKAKVNQLAHSFEQIINAAKGFENSFCYSFFYVFFIIHALYNRPPPALG